MAEKSIHDEEEKDNIEIVDENDESRSKIQKLKRELSECRTAKEEYLAGWQRAKADYINSERAFREREERSARRAEKRVLKDFLGIIDHFDNAFASSPPDSQWASGVRSIYDEARALLARFDVKAIETAGQRFSPHIHEALEVVETHNEEEDGMIVAELQKGYMAGDDVLRPAKVKVAHYNKGS